MSADPILVLQLQRMGDLLLTFPLLLSLHKNFPVHPIWVVAEPQFSSALLSLCPNVVFFPPSACEALAQKKFHLAINLSSRPEACQCLHNLEAEKKFGMEQSTKGLFVHGGWHLYRLGLTQNNHLNTFHWSDLYRLDVCPPDGNFWYASPKQNNTKRIALVVGASEPGKHPDATFWIELSRRLVKNGMVPMLIGGTAEAGFGEHIARSAKLPGANLCGKLKLKDVATLLQESALCITPDTGPMHLADWLGVPVLNLSMGPVHAAETGPSSPGQWILRANMSCVGCWQCKKEKWPCRQKFKAKAIADVVWHILRHEQDCPLAPPPGLELLQSQRDTLGLYRTKSMQEHTAKTMLEDFWHVAFLAFSSLLDTTLLKEEYATIAEKYPAMAAHLKNDVKTLMHDCFHAAKSGQVQDEMTFWQKRPPVIRLFAGQTHIFLQNANWSTDAWHAIMERLALLQDCTQQK